MDSIKEENIRQLKQFIADSCNIVVAGHTHPDGDALGATAAMALYLQDYAGKDVCCVFSDSPAANLGFILPESVRYHFHDTAPEDTISAINKADLIFLLDCNHFSRTEALEAHLAASKARKVLIDHHLNPDTESFDLVFSTPEISSASELLYWMMRAMEDSSASLGMTEGKLGMTDERGMTREVGTALLTGMTTDTNNFANSVFPSTFRMASELIASGVDRDALLQKIYNSYRENRVRAMGYMQSEGLTILPEGAAYMVLTKEIQDRFDIQDGETEGLVNVPLTIGKVRLSVLAKEDGDHFRISVRSKKGTSAQQLAQRFFHGGGHENASGGKVLIGADVPAPEAVPAYIETILKNFLG